MRETDELEPQQFERHYWEEDVPLQDVRQNALRKSVYFGLGLFVLIVLAGSLIKFPDEVTLPFVLRGETPERIYRFPYPVYIEQLYGQPGSNVKAGDKLARITSPEIVQLINNYRQAEDALANYRAHKTRAVTDSRDIIRLQAAQNMHMLQEIQQRQSSLQSTWKSNMARLQYEKEEAEKRLNQNQSLYKSKAISALELKEYEAASIRATDALNTATQNYHRDANALSQEAARYSLQSTSLVKEEDRYSADARTDSASLMGTLAQTRNAIQHTFGNFEIEGGSLLLKAEKDGLMSFLFEGDREVPASAILLKVTHRGSGLYATTVSPPSLIGKLQRGQTAFLKVATFPAYEWGAAKGHLDYLSLTPDEKGGFNVKIAIDEQRRLANRLSPGMNGIVSVQLDEKTFFQYFFRNMKRMEYTMKGEE